MVAKTKEKAPVQDTWVRKDRQYYLTSEDQPIVLILKSKNIMWFDEDKGYEREIKYTLNQKTPFWNKNL